MFSERRIKKINKFADEMSKWLAAQYDALGELKEAVSPRQLEEAKKRFENVGRAMRNVSRFRKRIDRKITQLPEQQAQKLEEIRKYLEKFTQKIMVESSRYKGKIKDTLSDISVNQELWKKSTRHGKEKVKKKVEELWKIVDTSLKETVDGTKGLQLKLRELKQKVAKL